jgi:ubiquitin carboxyl-terminal hydrolase L5
LLTLRPIHGLIFLFKWVPNDEPTGSIVTDDRLDKIFFAKQVINNACATQAIISILLNCHHQDMTLGQTLSNFKEFSQHFDSAMKGLALSNSDVIKQVHNSFSRQQMFEFESKVANKDDDVFHFVSYIPIDNRLYELDGLKAGPVDHGVIPAGNDWVEVARPIIEKRMQKYSEGEIHFNLMALISDKKMIFERRLQELQSQMSSESSMEDDSSHAEVNQLKTMIADEEAKMQRYKVRVRYLTLRDDLI